MVLERIVWKEDSFVKESDGEEVQPTPIGPIFSSYHGESMDYVDDITDFFRKTARYWAKENKLEEVNAFEGMVVNGACGGDYAIVKLYKI